MKSLCVITIQLNTLCDVPYEMTVGGAFVYVCERDCVKDFVYITRSVITRIYTLTNLGLEFNTCILGGNLIFRHFHILAN